MFSTLMRFMYFRVMGWLRCTFWRAVLSSSGGSLGRDAFFYESVRILPTSAGAIRIGDGFRILRNATLNTLGQSGQIRIGNGVHVGEGTIISSHCRVEIENGVIIGPASMIVDVDHACSDLTVPIRKQRLISQPIRIKEGAWIASHCVILKGVTIGRGAVVGAGSVVTHDVPDYAIVVGVPARIIRMRGQMMDEATSVKKPS